MLKQLDSFLELAKRKSQKTIAVAAAEDAFALDAIRMIVVQGLGRAILVGCREKIVTIAGRLDFDIREVEIIDLPDKTQACNKAVELVKSGKADILMKGLVDSPVYLRAILNKTFGIAASSLVTQMAFIQSPFYRKLFAITDAGINISPTKQDKKIMVTQSVDLLHRLDISNPKVALIAAVEHATPAIQATVDAAELSEEHFDNCIVEGPLSVDLAFSHDSCRHKGLDTRVGGDVDLIVLPDVNSANVFYKTVMQLGSGSSASVLTGTSAPVVFTSRSDTATTKYFSIACAIAQCKD
ncbi:phosphate acetytransferase [Kosakonia radicincitans]|uniref:phosphate acyltransferase n=1 Tax=Kosakonia radicincitans TaxID=283686 RepID=UPI0009A7CE04|nr:phosphate acyltransferase [Kosakonia radicincitans]QEM89149.1 phosphate acetytransferase [Kosakonia radicincitans]SKC11963.1 phosphate butyryltransferase [Kosakonia radicincitans]